MSTQINNMYRSTIIDYNDSYLTLKNWFTLYEGLLNLLIYKLNLNQGNFKKGSENQNSAWVAYF